MPTKILPYNIEGSAATAGQVLSANSTGGVEFTSSGSKWTTTGSDIYRNSNIGVGLSSAPVARVDVNGTSAHNVAPTTGTLDLSVSQMFTITTTAATTWSFTNVPATRGVTVVLRLENGGSFTQTWPASVKWPGGTAPTLTNPGVDMIIFVTHDGGTTWHGNVFGKDIK